MTKSCNQSCNESVSGLPRSLICEGCGAEFTCGVLSPECWCEKVELSTQTREQLTGNYKECLCESCLRTFEKQIELQHP